MEELRPEDLEGLVQELNEEHDVQESPPQKVEELLRVLQSGNPYLARWNAAEQLGKLDTSSPRIVQALIVARKSDTHRVVRDAAARALRAPVHLQCLQGHPNLKEEAERVVKDMQPAETAPRREKAERFDRKKPSSGLELIVMVGMGVAWMGGSIAMYGSNLPVCVALFVTLVGATLVAWGLWSWLSPTSARNLFLTSHVQTEGAVTGLDKEKSRSDYGPNYRYYVTILFKADDANMGMRVMELKADVAHRIWKRTKTGDTVGVRYVPQDPRIALIQGEW